MAEQASGGYNNRDLSGGQGNAGERPERRLRGHDGMGRHDAALVFIPEWHQCVKRTLTMQPVGYRLCNKKRLLVVQL